MSIMGFLPSCRSHRLAIAESGRAPAIARTLDMSGREANHAALGAWLARAQA
jgi:hypothetical protein